MLQISFTHHQFGSENELFDRCSPLFPLEYAFALMNFEQNGLSQKILHQLKYAEKEYFAQHIADWTIEKLSFENPPDLMVTIPLHPKKEKKRGYNQLHLFAKNISEHFMIPLYNNLLKRNFYNQAQAKKDKNHRENLSDIFSATREITNQHVLLIDDVLTTGNTMASAAWEILKFQGNKVSILTMAID
jgi:ComF family protein